MDDSSINALIFDFDGLILDTEEPVYRSWQELYQSYGCALPLSTWAPTIGTAEGAFDPQQELDRLVGRSINWEEVEARRMIRERELVEMQPILPGVEQYLQDAKRLRLKIGLASSATCSWVVGHLTRLGLVDYFDCIHASDDVKHTKPDPELYLSVLEGLGVPGRQAIALEDSPNGIRAAKLAGMFCVAVPNPLTRQLSLNEADMCLDSLAELSLEDLIEVLKHRKPS